MRAAFCLAQEMGARLGKWAFLFRALPPQSHSGEVMRVDFYQLSRDPAPAVVSLLAGKALAAKSRVLVAAEEAMLPEISRALWEATPAQFLAHAIAGGEHDERQPILVHDSLTPRNEANILILADGHWRESEGRFDRVMLLFDGQMLDNARGTWRRLGENGEVERRFWKQQGGRWTEGP